MRAWIALSGVLWCASPASAASVVAAPLVVPRGTSILLDNRCDSLEWHDAAVHYLTEGVVMALKHDERFLYLCLRLPSGSYGSIDFYLQPVAGAPWNLHASAQLAEKQRNEHGWPKAWEWGNERGWSSPALPFRGVTRTETGVRVNFAPIDAREFQIGRTRFGPGPWRVMFELAALGRKQDREALFPAGAGIDDPSGWAVLQFTE